MIQPGNNVLRLFCAMALCWSGYAGAATGEIDKNSGLIIDDNWLLVNANCSACHSAKLVTQNRGSRQTWLEMGQRILLTQSSHFKRVIFFVSM